MVACIDAALIFSLHLLCLPLRGICLVGVWQLIANCCHCCFLFQTVSYLVTIILSMKTCPLDLNIAHSYFIAIAFVVVYPVLFELSWLRNAKLLEYTD